ncbi:MAG: NVEALA domain-containing protein [Bacteroidales bacterium]|nr:NVEALA domain-containing protein [Bacteroidales bacterium]
MKKFFIIAAVAAASIFGLVKANDVNVNNNMSELQMENVELLAEGEGGGYACPGAALEWEVPGNIFDTINAGYDCLCKRITFSKVLTRC